MTQVVIPDELAQRVQSQLKGNGEDLASFTARALNEMLATDEDPLLQSELIDKTRQGFQDMAAGRFTELRPGAPELAAELGLSIKK